MKIITFFNNKGGVGKTTLAANIASYLAIELEKRILMVDADPQSNTTQLIFDEVNWEEIYSNDSVKATLLDFLEPLLLGDATLNFEGKPISKITNRYAIDVIPGHPRLSFMEDKLSENWRNCTAGDIGGFRVTNWVKSLGDHFSTEYDYLIFDVGPSLGALNRSILLNSDYFVTPMGCDIFSLMGIENISSWISSWKKIYENSLNVLRSNNPNFNFTKFSINIDIDTNFKFIGFSVQQYITKIVKKGERRGIAAYERIKRQIPDSVEKNLSILLPPNITIRECDLGDVPNYFSLVPLSQTSKCPIHQLKKSDGLVGNHYSMINNYKNVMEHICRKILHNMGERQ